MAPESPFIKLRAAVHNILAILHTLRPAIQSPALTASDPSKTSNSLSIYSDASKLLKAQTTKLSLLLLNQPYTPSEIVYILDTLSNGCLPAYISASELCAANVYSRFLGLHLQSSVKLIWDELENLVRSIPVDEGGLNRLHADETHSTLSSTGILWAECDKVTNASDGGLSMVAVELVTNRCALLEDAIEELEEWDPDDDSDTSTEDDEKSENNGEKRANKGASLTPTTSDEETLEDGLQRLNIGPAVLMKARVLKHLKMIKMLYLAIKKRRIATFPQLHSRTEKQGMPTKIQISILDEIMTMTQCFTEEADEIAGALYAEDPEEVERRLKILMASAKQCVDACKNGWDGSEDEFSKWSTSWVQRSDELVT